MIYNMLNQMKPKNLGAGKYADGQGLWIIKRTKSSGKWVLRLSHDGKRREMGLGPWPDVPISEARERAAAARKQMRDGIDPIDHRQTQRQRPNRISFAEAVAGCIKARQAELKGDGKAGRWLSPLNVHILPKLGKQLLRKLIS